MTKIKPGGRVRVVRDLHLDVTPIGDLIGMEGTVVHAPPSLGLDLSEPDPSWIRVSLPGLIEIFHPDELEVIEP